MGRQPELDRLRATAERAFRERTLQVVTVVGEAGLGKSRLAQGLVSALDDDATVLVGRCVSYGEGITFGPLREAVRQAAGDESPAAVIGLLRDDDDRDAVAAAVASAIGVTTAKVTLEETFRAFSRLFVALARERPLLLVFEDIHWAEPTFLDLVEHVAARTRDAPVLILCLTRTELLEERPSWMTGNPNAATIVLEPLSHEESGMLLDELAGEAIFAGGVRARMVGAAEGNPLFLEQMFAMLAEEQHSQDEVALPPTIRAVLAARLDRLGPGERAVVERASILGRDFRLGGLLALLPDEARASARRHVDTLVRRQLVEPRRSHLPGEDDFRFHHVLIHDAAYRAIPKELRAELHERFADWLAQETGRQPGEVEEILGYHLERAYRYWKELGPIDDRKRAVAVRACEHLASAGSRALDRGDVAAAAGLLERSLALAPEEGASSGEIMYRLAEAHGLAGHDERASELRRLALEEATAAGDRRLELRLGVAEADAEFDLVGGSGVAADLISRLIPELQELGDDLALARAWSIVGRTGMAAGRHADALSAFERALEHAQRADDVMTVDTVAVSLVNVMGDGPTPVTEALERADTLLSNVLGRVGAVAIGATVGFLLAMQGRLDEARALHARTRAQFDEMGIRAVAVRALAGEAELLAGDPLLAERELAAAWDLLSPGHQATPWITERLARALRELGRLEEAERFLEIADRQVSPAEGELIARTKATKALIRLDRGDLDGAAADALRAEQLSDCFDSPPFESPRYRGEILLAVAQVLQATGRCEDAADRAIAAVQQFERKGNVVSAERARELVRALDAVSPRAEQATASPVPREVA
ncbi:MAG: ATP-binding protein [Gaiellaceae bacterium]